MTWKTVEKDGYPEPTSDPAKFREFFCWAPGWEAPMVAEVYENPPGVRGFCCSGGGLPEVTHYMPVAYPEIPSNTQQEGS